MRSLRVKVLGVVAASLLLLFLVQYFAARYVLLRGYAGLEQEKTVLAVKRALSLVRDSQGQLDGIVNDWAAWDDAYAYMRTRDERFIQSNFTDSTFQHLKINASMLVRPDGDVLFARGFDLVQNKETPLHSRTLMLVAPGGPLLNFKNVDDHISGFVMSGDEAWMVSSYPVLTSDSKGPLRGALVMMRKLDGSLIERLEEVGHMKISFRPLSAALPADCDAALADIAAGTAMPVKTLGANSIAGYAIVQDIVGKPLLLMRVETDREIYAQGLSSLNFLFWSTFVIGGVLLVFSAIFDRVVLFRLAKLSADVRNIGDKNSAYMGRVEVDAAEDELALLGQNINNMLDRLDESQRSLRESEARHRVIFSSAGVIKLLLDAETGWILDASPTACTYYGYGSDSLRGMNLSEITCDLQSQALMQALHEAVKAPDATLHLQSRLRSGERRECEVHLSLIHSADRLLLYAIVFDVTERKRFEEALYLEKERAQATLISIADAVIATDEDGLISFMNGAAENLTGISFRTARGRPLMEVLKLYRGDRGAAVSMDWLAAPATNLEEIRLVRDDEMEFLVQKSAALLHDKNGRIFGTVTVLHDVTTLNKLTRQLSFQETHDALTGLVNRREFDRLLQTALDDAGKKQRMHAVAYLDLDKFKMVNDSCGRPAGDQLLRQLTEEIKLCLRSGADTLARLGDDEFGMLLMDCSPDSAMQLAQRVLQAIIEFRFNCDDKIFHIGASMGLILIRPDDRMNLGQLLSAVDIACYVAKEEGGSRIHVYRPGDYEVGLRHSHVEWAARIGECMEKNRFRVYWQPMRALKPGLPPHCELLIRMYDEAGNVHLPAVFLPAAERYHLMPQIDRWMVSAALRILAGKGKEFPYTCAINLSGQTLGEETFLDYVTQQFDAYAVDPGRICFEITETSVIENLTRAKQFISQLRQLGCYFSLDDFGSGLSSFGYLKTLDVDFLKVDGMFVRNIVHNPVDRAMVEAIRHVGHVMELQTIAEFVENEQTITMLTALGIDYAQGYGVAKPELFE